MVALYDTDPTKVGEEVAGVPVFDLDAPPPRRNIDIGIIATPGSVAQEVAERLAAAEVRSILNFAPTGSARATESRCARWTSLPSSRSSATTAPTAEAAPGNGL